jgi:hypothetical protein
MWDFGNAIEARSSWISLPHRKGPTIEVDSNPSRVTQIISHFVCHNMIKSTMNQFISMNSSSVSQFHLKIMTNDVKMIKGKWLWCAIQKYFEFSREVSRGTN